MVSYRFNSLGCRGPDHEIPKPSGRRRILVIGGSSTLGLGVHESDTFAARLERSLNSRPHGSAQDGYDVINCGVNGQGMKERRDVIERMTSVYGPDLVLLGLSADDDLSWREAADRGHVSQPSVFDTLLLSLRVLRSARSEFRRTPDYSEMAKDLADVVGVCRSQGVALAVVVLRAEPMTPSWAGLLAAVSSALQGTDVPVLDVGSALLEEHTTDALRVHDSDPHPNEIAHRVAAEAIEGFLTHEAHLVD